MIAEWKLDAKYICLFREPETLAFSNNGRHGARTQFKPLIYNDDYAANLVAMFYKTIEANLKNDEPHSSSFIPLLFKEIESDLKVQVALFGRLTPAIDRAQGELKGLCWGIFDPSLDQEYTLDVQDVGTAEYVRWAPHVNFPQNDPSLSKEVCEQYNKRFTFKVETNPNRRIQKITLKFQRSWYEVNGRTCAQALSAYLIDLNVASLQTLRQLGLAPTQITADQCTEIERAYFKTLVQQLDTQPKDKQEIIFANFEAHYPTLFAILLTQTIKRLDEQPVDHSYALILDTLKQQVIGQDYAITQLATALKAQKAGDNKWRVFLCVGPTGVGKTEVAKAAAKLKQDRYVRFDMNQFKGEVDFYKLFGSAPGYVGSTDQPLFARELEPYASPLVQKGALLGKIVTNTVILFDELEKAHSEVKQNLLTLFDEGYCKVQYSKDKENLVICYTFQKCIFIGTSNLYKQEIMAEFAQDVPPATIATHFVGWNQQKPLLQGFTPELMGRMQPLPFSPIPKGKVYQDLIKTKLPSLLSDLQKSVNCLSINVEETDLTEVTRLLETKHYGDGTGIRKIKQYFQNEIETKINQQHEWGNLQDKCLSLIPFDKNALGIKCVRKIYGKIIHEYASIKI